MPDLQSAHFHAGFARVDITPPVGFPLSGYAVREGGSKSVDMPLSLSAVTVREGQETGDRPGRVIRSTEESA